MPPRRRPPTLESLCLRGIGSIFASACECAVHRMAKKSQPLEKSLNKSAVFHELESAIEQMQILFFDGTAHYFHQRISWECLNALVGRRLHWKIVTGLCDLLPYMPSLERLNLAGWSCRSFSLLADHNQREGWQLCHLTNITHVSVTEVGEGFFRQLGNHCPNLVQLHVCSSNITDSTMCSVSKCSRLTDVELLDNDHVTPVGFAQLLRANSAIKSLGRCNVFDLVLQALYGKNSIYRRSVSSGIPDFLRLESVDTCKKISPTGIRHLARRCPFVRHLNFRYLPTDQEEHDEQHDENNNRRHLAHLLELHHLSSLGIVECDFFGHSLFRILGPRLTDLRLTGVDEMNNNAILLIGETCRSLVKLGLVRCHFQLTRDNSDLVTSLASARRKSSDCSIFQTLSCLELSLLSPAHLPVAELILRGGARQLRAFRFALAPDNFEEDLLRTLLYWGCTSHLQVLEVSSGTRLSLHAVNMILELCPLIRRVGRLDRWGLVSSEQVSAVREEARVRNLDLVLDTGENLSPESWDTLDSRRLANSFS